LCEGNNLISSAFPLAIFFIAIIPLAAAGITLINTGLSRSRNAAHTATTSLFVFSVAAIVYVIAGCAWIGYPGRPSYSISLAGKAWTWIAAEPFFLRGLAPDGSAASLSMVFQMFGIGLAALVPIGAAGERWRLGASCASTGLLAAVTYPLFANWSWGGGWLAQLGTNAGIGRGFLDAGGSGPIHVTGGLTALSVVWILGPRRGKYTMEGMPAAMPGHNAVVVLFGCMLALSGWIGLNSAGTLLYTNADAGRTVLAAVNTLLSAAAGGLAAALITRARFGRPDASLCANSWIGGLVASSAGCAFMAPAAAILVGSVAGSLVVFSIEILESRFGVDDPGGAVSVHAVSGLWGILAAGLFCRFPGDTLQFVAQLAGIATLVGFVFPLSYGLNWLLDRLRPQRIAPEGERQGLDLYELGAGAYPEFVTHKGDFSQL
jgi:Amt family ammonium transporter